MLTVRRLRPIFVPLSLIFFLSSNALPGPLDTRLHPQTTNEYSAYVGGVEQDVTRQWDGPANSVEAERSPELLSKVKAGDVLVHPSTSKSPVTIYNGLVHDWTGDVFIPNTTVAEVITLLQDVDKDAHIYPEITRSRLLTHNSNHVTGYWRVERKTPVVDIVLDVFNNTEYRQVAPGKWTCFSRSDRIQQVADAGTGHERLLPQGEGYGFLWQLNSYWVFEARDGGVLVECRSLSLSRTVPGAIGWMVNPIIRDTPRNSLVSTLEATRKAALALHASG